MDLDSGLTVDLTPQLKHKMKLVETPAGCAVQAWRSLHLILSAHEGLSGLMWCRMEVTPSEQVARVTVKFAQAEDSQWYLTLT